MNITGQEEQLIAAKPTDNPEAYDAYLRGLAYTRKRKYTIELSWRAEISEEAVRLDPKFALAWALLSIADAGGYITKNLQPTDLSVKKHGTLPNALTLQPDLGEAMMAKGRYHYACLKDYDTAMRYFEQARQFLPNSSRIPEWLAYVARRQGQWDRSEAYFKEAERLDQAMPIYSYNRHILIFPFVVSRRRCGSLIRFSHYPRRRNYYRATGGYRAGPR